MDFNIEKKGYNKKEVDDYLKKLADSYESALSTQKSRIQELKGQLSETEKQIKTYREKSNLVTKAIYNAVAKADEIEKVSKLKYNQEISQLKAFHAKWTDYFNRILDAYPLDETLEKANKFHLKMSKILESVSSDKPEQILEQDAVYPERAKEPNVDREEKSAETQIGYIKIKTEEMYEDDENILTDMIPDADKSSPIMTGNFDPIERINRYFASEKQKQTASVAQSKSVASDKAKPQSKEAYSDRSPAGFSFEEALNPKEDLAQIMSDLGLLLDND